ncbi:MAG: Asp-tRNA(Asn)/Glu-tRNA(Gln) amidotransferase subunit GatC [Dissulfurimicrobium sp.]|uniref:Asp-tRNA(Asn)/Glu-tRNA(Gln) amidotransferase subunit GatC n=1 Tax=Dissulfurimicrobium TaxID=1769732 RepID=UPI001EDA21AD|nr:Asp-tRNA(Asn)/Glu-tRNA(Gln) amidotransferase subunit GatC [Dissulfurimicrobium hydrothermale]UKL13609.1 Asp-tRNA(Asn)/Glu-tRNA(Gln) amidotransferase subunit GatC [Dissulfurimicrobium hydrothermale]
MKITRLEVEHIANLACLSFDQDEIEGFTVQLNEILEYVAKLGELDTGGVSPLAHSLDCVNRFRDDVEMPSLSVEDALKNAPQKEDGAFAVPKII